MKGHLSANGIELDRTPATLGAMLTLDPTSERFTGEFSEPANEFLGRSCRPPFVIPKEV